MGKYRDIQVARGRWRGVVWVTLVVLFACPALARRILVLYRGGIPAYMAIVEAVAGLADEKVLTLDVKGDDQSPGLANRLRGFRPELVVAVGKAALKKSASLEFDAPVVFCMVLHPGEVLPKTLDRPYVGLGMFVDPREQVEIFVKAFEWAKTVGFIYTEEGSGELELKLKNELIARQIRVVETSVGDSRDALVALESLKERVNAYWLLPDRVVLTEPFLQRLMEVSFRYSQPVVTFSRKGVEAGADLALVFDERDVAMDVVRLVKSLNFSIKRMGYICYPCPDGN